MEILIQKMTPIHIPAVSDLEKECFSEPWSAEALSSELSKDSSVLLCALDGETLLGYCGIQTVLDEGYITNIAVYPKYRGNGIGKALVEDLLSHCLMLNLDFVTLEVRQSNQAAINLYKGLGFVKVGLRKNFYSHPQEDALLMTYFFNMEATQI